MSGPPPVPRWLARVVAWRLGAEDSRTALAELAELHEAWVEREGAPSADRRFRRELRRYAWRSLTGRGAGRPDAAGASAGVRGGLRGRSPGSLRQVLRGLRRAPGLSASIVATVGIGIGGCTAVFAVVDVLFIRGLPYEAPAELVSIHTASPEGFRFPFSVADYQALAEQQTRFRSVAAYRPGYRTLLVGNDPQRLPVLSVTASFFETLGIQSVAGRLPSPDEEGLTAEPTVVVTAGFARTALGPMNSGAAIGRRLQLDGIDHAIIGVVPTDVGPLTRDARVFATLQLAPPSRRGPFFLRIVGRVAPGTEPSVAESDLRAINQRIFPVWQDTYRESRSTWGMVRLDEALRGDASRLLILLMAAGGVLLLIATVNSANLLLARLDGRRRELAVRSALGADSARILGLLLTESLLLAGAGAALGLLIARGGMGLLPIVAGEYLPRLSELRLSPTVLGFAGLLALASGIVFGGLPALLARGSTGAGAALRSGGRSSTAGRSEARSQRWLVSGQVALAVPLLTAAALLLASFSALGRVDPGFDPEGLVSLEVSPSPDRYPRGAERAEFWRRVLEEVRATPGVLAAGVANARPPVDAGNTNNFDLEDSPTPAGENQPLATWVFAERGFFESLGIGVEEGRLFEKGDYVAGAEDIVVVDRAWADQHFPGQAVVGRRLHEGGSPTWTTVVGVVNEVPFRGLGGTALGTAYSPWIGLLGDPVFGSSFLNVRVAAGEASMVPELRRAVARVDATVPLTRIRTGRELLADSLVREKHLSLVLAGFALMALLLAAIGLYGITTYMVQRRRPELAVRLALGAAPTSVLRLVLQSAMRVTVWGLALGAAASVLSSRVLTSFLYGVSAADLRALGGVAVFLSLVALAACVVPGHRAMRVDPATALREE